MKVKPPIWDRNKKSGQFPMIWKIQKFKEIEYKTENTQNRIFVELTQFPVTVLGGPRSAQFPVTTLMSPCDHARESAKCSFPCDHAHESLWPCSGVREVLSSLLLRSWVPVTVLGGPRSAQFPVTTLRNPCDHARASAKCSVPCYYARESTALFRSAQGVVDTISAVTNHCSIQTTSRDGGHNLSRD